MYVHLQLYSFFPGQAFPQGATRASDVWQVRLSISEEGLKLKIAVEQRSISCWSLDVEAPSAAVLDLESAELLLGSEFEFERGDEFFQGWVRQWFLLFSSKYLSVVRCCKMPQKYLAGPQMQ